MPRRLPSIPPIALSTDQPDRLKSASMLASPSGLGATAPQPDGLARHRMVGFQLAHEQFPVPELVRLGTQASEAGFKLLTTSDHFQPWQANEGHAGEAWVTLAALGARVTQSWMGTTVTCPILRYEPAVVAQTFASLSQLSPGRIFLGVGSGEALNEQAATGVWPSWRERWDRLIEAVSIIRQLWTGQHVSHKGAHYAVEGRLYDPPPQPIPLLIAANGRKSMRLAGQHGDGLITNSKTWKQHKAEWEAGARAAGKNPAEMPVLVEHYVLVGDEAEAKQAADLWRFGPKAFPNYFNIPSPVEIERRAKAETPLETVISGWAVGTDPDVHVQQIKQVFDSGASMVAVHSGQPDQQRVIAFYAQQVLPKLRSMQVTTQ